MGNINSPQVYHNPRVAADEPAPLLNALKDAIVSKVTERRSSRSSANSTKTATHDDAASTYSTVSSATTLEGSENSFDKKKKWFTLSSKGESEQEIAQKALHAKAVADYMSLR